MKKSALLALLIIMFFSAGCKEKPADKRKAAPAFKSATVMASQSATYKVIFKSTWSKATHPWAFPASPHYSGLIGATHNDQVRFWQVGQPASPGIKNMAETGSKSPLDREVNQAIKSGTAERKLSGPWMPLSPGTVSMSFKISQGHPLVTLVAMIAPSPDWFVGVDSLPLFVDRQWIEQKVIPLYLYDAGTDSGESFESRNKATRPAADISRFRKESYGTFTFIRQ